MLLSRVRHAHALRLRPVRPITGLVRPLLKHSSATPTAIMARRAHVARRTSHVAPGKTQMLCNVATFA